MDFLNLLFDYYIYFENILVVEYHFEYFYQNEDNYSFQLLNHNQNEKKGCNNFVLKSEFNPNYNNSIYDINKINLLYNYFGDENKELKKKIKKNNIQINQIELFDSDKKKKKKKNKSQNIKFK